MSRRRSIPVPSGPAIFSERPALACALDAALHTPARPLVSDHPSSSGAYLQLYRGPHPLYQRIAVCDLDEVSVASSHGWPIYAGSAQSIHERSMRHSGNLAAVVDLEAEDFVTVILPTDTLAGALMVERFLVDHFKPLFNQPFLGGFASRPQGKSREKTQRTAPFSVLHSGRRACSGPTNTTPEALASRVADHLTRSVPDWWTDRKR